MRDLRKPYAHTAELTEASLRQDPFEQLRVWFDDAVAQNTVEWFEPNAATLATSSANGQVTARTILVKGIAEDGLLFFTNYDSFKGQQLAENPRAALVFYWAHVVRQVRVEGLVEKTSQEVSKEYFHTRPRGSQIGAVVSPQSQVIPDRTEMEHQAAELLRQLGDDPVPMPDHWGGYRLIPTHFEFWQGRLDRLHDRFGYRRTEVAWIRERLAP